MILLLKKYVKFYPAKAALTAVVSEVVGRPIKVDNCFSSSYKSPFAAPLSKLAIAVANSSGKPASIKAFA
ncbi:hypothetical protein [Sphingobacterium sp. IITKGP-BTPF85]|uniref:hypothetical protein n=1 Tax=Sphingobacterium sp. IITKGP-BTPF85 TaxID=1338009 RepID=UPI00038A2094|nr:hypothetical protein [Sphingobacterium sp. IITKGP-BTPF85]KKX50952.1 hypothetical protein L950_0207330 [Sphingobacterium sp. IITKGP-BTPF85]